MLRGLLAAAVTPLREGGSTLDEEAFEPLVAFLAHGGADGVFALGTTGEGILLTAAERRRAAELFLEAGSRRELAVAIHCGAQTTAETVELAAHARENGADAVAVVGPPYYAFDDAALVAHLAAAAHACDPVPFFVYEFSARSGYAIPVAVVERLREEAPNVAGLKVSDTPFARVEPYFLEGLAVFVGSEPLIPQALERGAHGAVSGLASAFPEVVAALLREGGTERADHVRSLRESLQRFPFNAALKRVLASRGVPVREDVRAPLRTLVREERAELDRELGAWLESPARPARA